MGNKKTKNADPTVLTRNDIDFLTANTSFNEDEIAAWHADFLVISK
jgi:hypothetical protein